MLLLGCEVEKVQIPRTESRVAVHGVLSATAASQVILLERTRNGSVSMTAPSFDLLDPIGSDPGIAEAFANVTVTTPGGPVWVAREEAAIRGDGKGRGVYRLTIPGSALERGGTYRLTVRTLGGEVLTAETSVPNGVAAVVAEPRTFDRARDTAVVAWDAVAGARSYQVRVETPFGPRAFFTSDTHVRLTGDLRNPEIAGVPRVFFPGFPQAVTVSAVDSNYYDWFRSHNDAISGTGLVSRVQGGLGVFGALVRVRYLDFRVTAPRTEPVEGVFRFAGTPSEQGTTPFLGLELYVESHAARADQTDAISGRYDVRPRFGYSGCLTCGLLGSHRDGRIQLALLRDWSARDTAEVFIGEVRGDTIVGLYRGFGGIVRFVKQR